MVKSAVELAAPVIKEEASEKAEEVKETAKGVKAAAEFTAALEAVDKSDDMKAAEKKIDDLFKDKITVDEIKEDAAKKSTGKKESVKKAEPKKDAEKTNILSMTVKNIENDDEMSVYATAGHSGVLIISVEPGSEAERIGLRENDVIIAWGSAEICTVSDLKNCAFDGSGVTILRKQQKVILK